MTAAAVAWARAAGDPGDRVAPTLIPRMYRRALGWTAPERLGARGSTLARRVISGGLTDHMQLRTAAIDALIAQSVSRGLDQLVLLGAGLDSRAHRLALLEDVRVWEVDHPATQSRKQRRAATLPLRCLDLAYVPVDFERESLAQALQGAGLDPTRPALWIWEGVTMYLPAAATEATLGEIASISPPGSQLVMTYLLPQPAGAASRWAKTMFRVIGEPLIGGLKPSEVRTMLNRRGFRTLADGSNQDWARELGGRGAAWALLFRAERMVLAERAKIAG